MDPFRVSPRAGSIWEADTVAPRAKKKKKMGVCSKVGD